MAHYAFHKNSWENYEKMQFQGVGEYDIPEIFPTDYVPEQLMKFNYRGKVVDKSKSALHFFMYDYLFMSAWHFPERHIDDFKKYGAIITPDFSVYIDFPYALQVLAHYRRQWLGRYYQEQGVTVIPDVAWSDKRSYNYCFDGLPKNSTVCVSSVGMTRTNEKKKIMIDGWEEMMKRIEPKNIILYGEQLPEFTGNIIRFNSCIEQYKKEG